MKREDHVADRETTRRDPIDAEEPVHARSFERPTLSDRAMSTALWAAGISWLVPSLGAMTAVYNVVPAHRVNALGRAYCKVQIALTGNRWRAVVDPAIDSDRPYLFFQNHTNHFDHVFLYNATPHFKQGIELASHFRYPVYGWFMKARGTIPVVKGANGQTVGLAARIGEELHAGRSILAFPEGTRTTNGRLGEFRRGIFYVARELGAAIVPVAVTGAFDMMRKGSLLIRPGNEITVYCDAPIETAGLTDEDVPALADRVHAVMRRRIDRYWDERERR